MAEYPGKFFEKNGLLTPIDQFDPGFLNRSHYIYEVFRVIDGIALFLEDHLERLYNTLALSGYPKDFVPTGFPLQVYELIEANKLKIGNIKVVVLPDSLDSRILMYVMEHQYPSESDFQNGVALVLQEGVRENPNAKVMDIELRNNANLTKQRNNAYESLLVDTENCITEGSRSNVFFVKGEEVISPPLTDILPGITYKHVAILCNQPGITFREEKVPVERLPEFDGVFITGTSRKVLPAFRIDEHHFRADLPVVRRLQAAFNQKVEQYVGGVLAQKSNKA